MFLNLTRWKLWIENLSSNVRAADRQPLWIEQPDLHQHTRLVPIDMLVRDFPVLESHDDRYGHFNRLACGRNAGQQPVDRRRMREADDHLVDDLVVADGA